LGQKQAKLLLGASVGILALTVFFMASGMGRPERKGKQPAASANKEKKPAEKDTVKRPLPDHLTEEQVPKWVPYRQPSGRTELEAWDSVDAGTARDAYFRQDIMAPKQSRTLFPKRDIDGFEDEPAGPAEGPKDKEGPTEEAPASAEPEEEADFPEEEPLSEAAEQPPDEGPPVAESELEDPNEAAG
jgi:hypothetical protein